MDPHADDLSAERLAFETLIADTSATLMHASAREVTGAIEAALERVRTFFRADRCGLMVVSADRQVVNAGPLAYAVGVPQVASSINVVDWFPWIYQEVIEGGRPVVLPRVANLPLEAAADRASLEALGTRSQMTVPIESGSVVTHLIVLGAVQEERPWTTSYVPRLRLLGEMIVATLQRAEAFETLRAREAALGSALEEVKLLREQLERENVYLRKEVSLVDHSGLVTGSSPAIRHALALAEQVGPTSSTVLLTGETGTGKERFAEFIHQASPRRSRHMIRVNCSAIPSALIESELFGREKGAYTGALSKQIGRFELATGSTIFLDEIGDLPLEVQVKLLRVLQERTIERLGSPAAVPVDVRVITATNRDLEAAVDAGTFRADLYYRLNVFPIVVPALRDRREDIPRLVDALVNELSGFVKKRFDSVDRASLRALTEYDWPGNIRELRNVLERAMILETGPRLTIAPPNRSRRESAQAAKAGDSLREVERNQILRVLEQTGWRVRGKNAAAEILGLKPTTLEGRMERLGIHRPGAPRQS